MERRIADEDEPLADVVPEIAWFRADTAAACASDVIGLWLGRLVSVSRQPLDDRPCPLGSPAAAEPAGAGPDDADEAVPRPDTQRNQRKSNRTRVQCKTNVLLTALVLPMLLVCDKLEAPTGIPLSVRKLTPLPPANAPEAARVTARVERPLASEDKEPSELELPSSPALYDEERRTDTETSEAELPSEPCESALFDEELAAENAACADK